MDWGRKKLMNGRNLESLFLNSPVFPLKKTPPCNLITTKSEKEMTLKQACPPEYQRAQCAFKNSMIHENLQFTLSIAIRCALHRRENQEIHC